MEGKTVAERLRERVNVEHPYDACGHIREILGLDDCLTKSCHICQHEMLPALADAIEAEQAESNREQSGADVTALSLLADKLGAGSYENQRIAKQIRRAIEGETPSKSTGLTGSESTPLNPSKSRELPEGIVWPVFEDGELVRFGDAYVNAEGNPSEVRFICAKAEGFKIGRGQTKNRWQAWGEPLKRPEPEVLDSQEAIDADAAKDPCTYFNGREADSFDCDECPYGSEDVDRVDCHAAMTRDLLRRQRRILGGE